MVKHLSAMQEMQEMWVGSLGRKDPLEEETATHSSSLAWEIPWIGEPGGPQSMESQKVQKLLIKEFVNKSFASSFIV